MSWWNAFNEQHTLNVNDIVEKIKDIFNTAAVGTLRDVQSGKQNYKGKRLIRYFSKSCKARKKEYQTAKNKYRKNRTEYNHQILLEKSKAYKQEAHGPRYK